MGNTVGCRSERRIELRTMVISKVGKRKRNPPPVKETRTAQEQPKRWIANNIYVYNQFTMQWSRENQKKDVHNSKHFENELMPNLELKLILYLCSKSQAVRWIVIEKKVIKSLFSIEKCLTCENCKRKKKLDDCQTSIQSFLSQSRIQCKNNYSTCCEI